MNDETTADTPEIDHLPALPLGDGAVAPDTVGQDLANDPSDLDEEHTGTAAQLRLRRAIRIAGAVGVVAWTATAFAGGVAFGTRQRVEPLPPPASVVIDVEQLALPDTAPSGSSTNDTEPDSVIANVIGLDVQTATTIIGDNAAGVTVNVVEQPAAGDIGFVIAQDPAPGTADADTVTLTVTAATPMPDLVGAAREDAVQQLEASGARVAVTGTYQRGATPGTVLTATPADGPIPNQVALSVAVAAATAELTQLDPVDFGCRLQTVNVNGTAYERAIRCTVRRSTSTPAVVAYDLGRDVDVLTFGVGLTDDSELTGVGELIVNVDGVDVYTAAVGFGTLTPVELDTAGALRVTFTVRGLAEDVPDDVQLAIVDARINGAADSIDELVQR